MTGMRNLQAQARAAAAIAAALWLLAGTVPRSSATALARFDVSVFPAKIEIGAAPGTAQTFSISVHNHAAEPVSLNVYNVDFFVKPDNEFVFRSPGHYSYSCAKWISTDSPSLEVPPGKVVRKEFMVSVPGDAEPGSHSAAIMFELEVPPGKVVKGKPRIGAIVYTTVPGQIIRSGKIEDVRVSSTWFWPAKPLPLFPRKKMLCRVTFYNSGNVHLTIRGYLSYRARFGRGGRKVFLGEITVLPKTRRYLEAPLKEPPGFGTYAATAEVSYGPSLDVFDTTVKAETDFHVYPSAVVAIPLALILTAAALGLIFLRKRPRKTGPEAGPRDGDGTEKRSPGGTPLEEHPGAVENGGEPGSQTAV